MTKLRKFSLSDLDEVMRIEKRLKEISLCVRTQNKLAISFYENLGFEILKTIKDYYPNEDNAYLMKKEI